VAKLESLEASNALRRLEALWSGNDAKATEEGIALLTALERARFRSATELIRFHEHLCRLRAYPDDERTLRIVERILDGFAARNDLARRRTHFANTGIAGAVIEFRFYWPTAQWLANRVPGKLTIAWPHFENKHKLQELLHLLFPYYESLAFEELAFTEREWIEELRGRDETDAAFTIHRFASLDVEPMLRESLYDGLDIPIRIEPGRNTPSRTSEKRQRSKVHFRVRRERPKRYAPRKFIRANRPTLRWLSGSEAREVIDLAKSTMVTRERDLHGFMHANRRDVCLLDFGDGLELAGMGLEPTARYVLEGLYVFLILRNGVPIGYSQAAALFESCEINFNLFDTFRGVETSRIYVSTLAAIHRLFKVDTFSVNTQQLGENNQDALDSGAWWFYYNHGFRPRQPTVRALMRRELHRKARNPSHRSSIAVLRKLATDAMHLSLERSRSDIVASFPIGEVGLEVSRYVAARFGADREAATKQCAEEAALRLGVSSLSGISRNERRAWERFGPLILLLPGVDNFSPRDRTRLADVIRAKGGRRESDYVKRFDEHVPLRRALVQLGERVVTTRAAG